MCVCSCFCVFSVWGNVYMPQCMWGDESTTFRSQFLPLCVPGIKLKSSGLRTKCFYPWKHFVDSTCEMFKNLQSYFGAFSSKCLYHILTLRVQGFMQMRKQRWWVTLRKQHFPNTTGLMHIYAYWDCDRMHRPAQVQVILNLSMENWKWAQSPKLTKKLLQLITDRRGKISFLQWNDPGYINSTLEQASWSGIID